ncbi:MAG: UDP-N-acetyl-D-glucosamine 2-epimerase, UDP-hydrolysing, partial [Deltaproteobacteria bacterium RIFCSPLOWO2_01_44_7]
RADLGYMRFVIKELKGDPRFDIVVVATCMHLASSLGKSIQEFTNVGIMVDEEIEMLLDADTPSGIVKSMGLGMIGFADLLRRVRPDAVLIMGDRFEILSVVATCLPFLIPVIHIAGGDISEGAIDDSIRHAITKMSHFHLPATEKNAERLRQMGEEDWRIQTVGELTLDFLTTEKLMTKKEIENKLSSKINNDTLLVAYHPETMDVENVPKHVQILTEALSKTGLPMVITGPNVDVGSTFIRESLQVFAKKYPRAVYAENLGQRCYLSLMRYVGALVGNSSSGIVEAPSFGLPFVNIGRRQDGRLKALNVIDVLVEEQAILDGIQKALSDDFRKSLGHLKNPYGDGHASKKIKQALLEWLPKRSQALSKHFVER